MRTYGELLTPANLDVIPRTAAMAATVTLAGAVVGFPIAYYMARYTRSRVKALCYLAVMLPLWSSYLVRVYAWKLILAKEGTFNWVFTKLHLNLPRSVVQLWVSSGRGTLECSWPAFPLEVYIC